MIIFQSPNFVSKNFERKGCVECHAVIVPSFEIYQGTSKKAVCIIFTVLQYVFDRTLNLESTVVLWHTHANNCFLPMTDIIIIYITLISFLQRGSIQRVRHTFKYSLQLFTFSPFFDFGVVSLKILIWKIWRFWNFLQF